MKSTNVGGGCTNLDVKPFAFSLSFLVDVVSSPFFLLVSAHVFALVLAFSHVSVSVFVSWWETSCNQIHSAAVHASKKRRRYVEQSYINNSQSNVTSVCLLIMYKPAGWKQGISCSSPSKNNRPRYKIKQ